MWAVINLYWMWTTNPLMEVTVWQNPTQFSIISLTCPNQYESGYNLYVNLAQKGQTQNAPSNFWLKNWIQMKQNATQTKHNDQIYRMWIM